MIIGCILAAVLTPLHGVVVSSVASNTAVIRADDIPATLAAQALRVRLSPPVALRPGVGVDGFLDRSTLPWTLDDAVPAGPFAPGLPDQGRVQAVDVGKPL